MRTRLILLFLVIVLLAAFGADLVLRRGFRANNAVPPWEAKLARGVRNISIPRVEAEKKNPVPASAASFGEGRDSFS